MSYPTSAKEFDTKYPGYDAGLKVTLTQEQETLTFYVPHQGEPIQDLMRLYVFINGYKAQVESF